MENEKEKIEEQNKDKDKAKEQKQKRVEEMKEHLVKDFENNLNRMNQHPEELKKLEEASKLTEEDKSLKIDKLKLQKRDLELRKDKFKVVPEQAKFEFEKDSDWMANQAKLLDVEIKNYEFSIKLEERAKVEQLNNIGMQISSIEQQKDRCVDAHKVALKRLKKECNCGQEFINSLKKQCSHPCCR